MNLYFLFNLRKSCNKNAIVIIAIKPLTVRAITIDNSMIGNNMMHSETIDAIKGTTCPVLVMQNPSIFLVGALFYRSLTIKEW